MRLVGYLHHGQRWLGSVSRSAVTPLDTIESFYANGCRTEQSGGKTLDLGSLTQVPPVPLTARVLCLGVNYPSHAEESKAATGMDAPTAPMVFGRWASTLVVSGDPVPVPPNEGLDWEVELAVVIGRRAWATTVDSAMDHVLGYTVFNDLSARGKQLETSQFTLGKNADRSGPIGPVLVTADELGPPDALRLRTRVNGREMQNADTGQMVFGVPEIIAYITDTVTLRPGDVITTGTPGGVGLGRTPHDYLQPGDVVEVEIDRIGTVRTPVVARSDLDPALLP